MNLQFAYQVPSPSALTSLFIPLFYLFFIIIILSENAGVYSLFGESERRSQ